MYFFYLGERPDLLPQLVSWHFNQWGYKHPERTIESMAE
ncbi:MAG: hypothetical protein ACI8ZN_001914 [Bacteroidia bacterium]|jgi:hypothetical protein